MTKPPEVSHAQSPEELAAALGSDLESGLADAEAEARIGVYGTNELPKEKKAPVVLLFLKQFNGVLDYVLFAAAGISFFTGQQHDAYGILIAVLIDAVVGFIQEYRAEEAISKLRDMVMPEASVVRGGRVQRIHASMLVPGDIMLSSEGDHVAADSRIIDCKELLMNESSLTGESTSVVKSAGQVPAEAVLQDRKDMIWMGTAVVSGVARSIVTETGSRTAFGKIAVSLGQIKRLKTPFEKRIDELGTRLGLMSIILCVGAFILGYVRGFPVFEMFFFAVALVVSVIPEGLPTVLAVVLAIGIQRMAKRRAIIRRMPSVETLGVADVICTDKTGTLTENKMTVRRLVTADCEADVTGEGWDPTGDFVMAGKRIRPGEERELDLLLKAAALVPKAAIEWRGERPTVVGDPTEGALVVVAAKAGLEKRTLGNEYRVVDEIPFNSVRKYRAVLVERTDIREERTAMLFAVGAYDEVWKRSGSVNGGGAATEPGRQRFDTENAAMASQAMRVVAAAWKPMPVGHASIDDEDLRGLEFLGLAGMIDPPRPGVAQAIARCRSAGVRVIMITGDQKQTAVAIAREVGLLPPTGLLGVYTEYDVAGLNDTAFRRVLGDAVIFARATPDTKLRVVSILQEMGHTVAMTGDGVNDAPALKKASIGIAMGITGTDVSKEVADMVLADDNFVSIVGAIEEGRIVFRNVKQTAAYLFMTNVGEAVTVLASLLIGLPLPLLPAQILWMNLVTDGFPDVALATEGVHGDVLAEPPRNKNAPIISMNIIMLTIIVSAMMCVGTLALFAWDLRTGGIDHARSVAFTAMAVFQLWNVLNMRSVRDSVFSLGLFSNFYVTAAVAASLGLQLAVLYVPGLQSVFRTTPLGFGDWSAIVAVTSTLFFAVEGYKWLGRRGTVPKSWM